jgi:antitoxin HigA-1
MTTRMHNPTASRRGPARHRAQRLSVSELARKLKVSRVALSRVVNGRAAVSADMALRLAAALGVSAEAWLRMQVAYDLWHESKKRRPKVAPIKLAA